MTEAQIAIVQSTWGMVEPITDQAAILFYDRLFLLDPELKDLFPQEMSEQRAKLMKTIGLAVKGLTKLEALVPVVQDLGRRHVEYGVEDEDYGTVGEALLWTLGVGLGEAFTPEAREAWTTTYTLLADTMKAAAHEPTPN